MTDTRDTAQKKVAVPTLDEQRGKWARDFASRMNDATGPHWEDYERKNQEFAALGGELFDLAMTLSNAIATKRSCSCGPAA